MEQTYIKLVAFAHEGVVQQMAVDLRLDEDQVDKDDDKIVLDILVAKLATVPADRQSDVVSTRLVTCARVLGPERLDGVLALDADGHRGGEVG